MDREFCPANDAILGPCAVMVAEAHLRHAAQSRIRQCADGGSLRVSLREFELMAAE